MRFVENGLNKLKQPFLIVSGKMTLHKVINIIL